MIIRYENPERTHNLPPEYRGYCRPFRWAGIRPPSSTLEGTWDLNTLFSIAIAKPRCTTDPNDLAGCGKLVACNSYCSARPGGRILPHGKLRLQAGLEPNIDCSD
jgi:hypothetical protein